MTAETEKLREKLDDAYRKVRDDLPRIHEALDRVDAGGPEADLEDLLHELEKVVHDVRTGGLLGKGSNAHKRARADYLEAKGLPT
jgi:hypothetical protein